MEAFIKLQENSRLNIVKARSNFKKSPKERLTSTYIETRIEILDNQWKAFENTHQKMIFECDSGDIEKSSYSKKDVYEQTEEEYITYKSELKERLASLNINVTTSVQEDGGQTRGSTHLPKIIIPTFSGNFTEWTSFRDLFLSLIHRNKSLDDVQKLHYLKGYLKGEAEQLLRNVSITAANYKVCWEQLENRFNNKRHLANCILQKLIGQKNLTSESASAIKLILDTTNECLNALKGLDINISTWDVIVIYIISLKLDGESRRLWEVKVNAECDSKLPTIAQFIEFLEHRFRSIEFLDPKVSKPAVNRNNNAKTFHVAAQNCVYCSADHKLCNCKQFAKQDIDTRREFARTNKLCFNCLAQNHTVYFCRQATKCRICQKRHHSLLHPKKHNSTETVDDSVDKKIAAVETAISSSQSEHTNNVCCFTDVPNHGLLPTALVKVESQTGTAIVLRALMDQGSQVSFITEAAVQLLGLKKTSAHTDIFRLGDDQGVSMPSKWTVRFKLQSRLDPSFVLYVDAYVLKRLTSHLPERKIVQVAHPLTTLELADPTYNLPGKIDLLLSTRVVGEVTGLIKGPPGSPVAQKTRLGWILSGEINSPPAPVCCSAFVSTEVNDLIKRFWELESEPTSVPKILTEEEQRCETFYSNTTKRDETGRYVVKLPFKSNDPKCKYGESEAIARKRFLMLERRLLKAPELRVQYSAVIEEYIQLGHLEKVPQSQLKNHDAVYLPHHAVVRNDKSTTKVRVVFDASCSGCNGASLNDDLMVGPTLQLDLRQVIMRWRRHPICLSTDIVKMYRQVKVSEDDVDYQRILWRGSPDSELQHYRLLRVTFGTSSAPYLAVRSLQQLAHDEGEHFPLASERVLKDYYVDDLMTGCQSIDEGEQIYHQMNQLLSRGCFQLQKWSSNSDELLDRIKDRRSEVKESLELNIDPVMKILGLTWNRQLDRFQYTVQLPQLETPVTKRRVISDIARLYDPLGWIAPAITTAKVFIQRLWLSGIGWDEVLPPALLNDWLGYRSNLHELQNFNLPRWIQTTDTDERLELQGFCDASISAYAAVVYVRCIDHEGHIHVSLVASKTKVAPVKQISVPRLELNSAVLLAKLVCEVADTLNVAKDNIHAWTDSSVVLAWLSSHPSRWKTFVGNRVSEILTVMDNTQWSHVRSRDNPADCASRGISPAECAELKLWKEGPEWLKHEIIDYNKGVLTQTNLEERRAKVVCHVTAVRSEDDVITKFSSLTRLLRVISYCRRFLQSGKDKNSMTTVSLTCSEINKALLTCIKLCQNQHFKDEIDDLKKNGQLNKKGKLTSLSPYLDDDDILRVGGRLHRAEIPEEVKHPVIIPHKSHFTNLLVADAHERTLHGGPQLMLNYLRSKYWVINAKSSVRQYFRRCVTCLRHSPRIVPPLMGQLPSVRVNASRPFYQSGVDYAGPISVRPTKGRGYHSTKGYICLFVCMASRAIHLEIVSDMTSQAFIAAFKRFTARRGHCGELWSDNGTTFVGANRELKALFSQERSVSATDIADWLATNGTKWHFIPPHSPNFGGLWEAGVKSTKHHLKRVIGTHTLTFEEMATVLAQIEACLNSRPISQISSHPEDPIPLTPGHLLIGEPLVLIPECNFENSNITTLKRWQLTQRLVQEFWRRWSREYLTQFHQRHKWCHQVPEPKVGDVVLVTEDDLPPARWLYGLITHKHTGADGVTRVVSLRCKDSVIKRPVSKLVVLPVTN